MNYSIMTEREVEIELSTSASEGLTSFTAHDRLIDNGRNTPEKAYAKSALSVFAAQFKNLYTSAFLIIGIITALCDFKGSMAAWMIFFAVAVLNMVSGFLRDNGERKAAKDFDMRRAENVNVIRDGKVSSIDPTLIVKGDVVVLKTGDFVPADIRVLRCDNLKADEAIFKGRNVPRDKKSERVEENGDSTACENILYCGSSIASGSGLGAVIATGKDTVIAKINLRKAKKLDMHDKFGKNAKSEKLLVLAAIVFAIVAMTVSAVKTKSFNTAMLQACTVAFCLLPAPVCIVRELAIKLWSMRIEKEDGISLEPYDYVYDVGMSEYLLFDKGGTLTESGMELSEKVISNSADIDMAVICSDCEYVDGDLTGNEMDKATLRALEAEGADVKELLSKNKKIAFMPFDEQRKLMAALIKRAEGYRLIVKGSADILPTLCASVSDNGSLVEMTGEMMHRLETISSSMAERGLKMRAVAYRDIDFVPENIEAEIKNLVFVGILGYKESLAENVKDSIEMLKGFYVKPVMVTGDHVITAAAIAKSAGLIESEKECVSFREFDGEEDACLYENAKKFGVFASATAEDRERLVKSMAEQTVTVAVAGEEIASPNVKMYADISFEEENIEKVSSVISKARAMRGNLAFASLLAIGIGLTEALVMLFEVLAGEGRLPSAASMLLINLFIVFVPCMLICLFGNVQYPVRRKTMLAYKAVIQGFAGAALCILFKADITNYAAYFAIIETIRIIIMYNIKRTDIKTSIYAWIVILGMAMLIAVFTPKLTAAMALGAVCAMAVNGFVAYSELKGIVKCMKI